MRIHPKHAIGFRFAAPVWALALAAVAAAAATQSIDLSGYPVVGLRFEGNQKLASEQLVELMRHRPGARYEPRSLERDLERLTSYYRSQGFLNARIVSTRTDIEELSGTAAPYGVRLTVTVEEGPYVALASLGLDHSNLRQAVRAYELYRDGVARLAQNDLSGAINAFRNSLTADPQGVLVDRLEFGGRGRVRLELALALHQQGERSEALEQFRQLVAAAPGDVASRLNLGQLQLELGRVREALTTLRGVTQDFPGERRAVLALGRALVSAGEIAEAKQYLRGRAEQGDIEARLLLGDSYRLEGDLERAAAELRRALEQAPLDYQGYARLAQAQESMGRPAEAAQTLRAYLDVFRRAFPQAESEAAEDAVLAAFHHRLEALSRSNLAALETLLGSAGVDPGDGAIEVRAAGLRTTSGATLATLELVFDSRRLAFQRGADGARASVDIVAEIQPRTAQPRRLRERAELLLPPTAAAHNDGFPLTHRLQLVMSGAPRSYRIAVRDPLGGNTWVLDGSFGADLAMAAPAP